MRQHHYAPVYRWLHEVITQLVNGRAGTRIQAFWTRTPSGALTCISSLDTPNTGQHLGATWIWASCVTSVPPFLLLNGHKKNVHLMKLIWRLNSVVKVNSLEQPLAFLCSLLFVISQLILNQFSFMSKYSLRESLYWGSWLQREQSQL